MLRDDPKSASAVEFLSSTARIDHAKTLRFSFTSETSLSRLSWRANASKSLKLLQSLSKWMPNVNTLEMDFGLPALKLLKWDEIENGYREEDESGYTYFEEEDDHDSEDDEMCVWEDPDAGRHPDPDHPDQVWTFKVFDTLYKLGLGQLGQISSLKLRMALVGECILDHIFGPLQSFPCT